MSLIKEIFSSQYSLRQQLFSVFTLSVLGLALISAVASSWFASNQMREQIINEGFQVTANLASQSMLALLYGSSENAEEAVSSALLFPSVSFVQVLDSDFKPLIAKGDIKNEPYAVLPTEYKNEKPLVLSESPLVWHFSAPVYSPVNDDSPLYIDDSSTKEFIGSVYVVVDKIALNKIQKTIFITNIGIALIITAIILFLLSYVLKHVTRPLNNLSQTMQQAKKGDAQVKAKLEGPEEIVHIASVFNDMMEVLDEKKEALFKEKERALITLNSIADGVITTDIEGKVLYLNPVAERLTGWRLNEINETSLDDIFQMFDEKNHTRDDNPILKCLEFHQVINSEQHCMFRPKIGDEIFVEDSVALTRDKRNNITGTVMVFHDVTETRNMAKKLSYQATHDSLTGLINRADFERYLTAVLSEVDEDTEHALCYMDLDQFKVINDTCGHMAGDQLLQNISKLLANRVRKSDDTLARLGGDEFVLLLENCPLEKAEKIAKSMCEAVQDYRFVWNDNPFSIGISIGLVPINYSNHEYQDILSKADSSCYMAKEKGRNRVHTYLVNDKELIQRQGEMNVVSSITEAYENDLFQLYYQPIVSMDDLTETTQHYEILIRMLDKEGNILPPGFFLPAAERYNLIHKVDRWVIRASLNWLARNPVQLENLKCCAINLSGMSLNDEKLFDFIQLQFDKTKVPSEKICFEITETAAVTNLSKATGLINQLRKLGCKSALDDFGSGMSSFAYLKNFPIDYLKIDGVFVKDIISDPIDNAMVKSINDIGHVLGLKTIAEYVEDEEILVRLKELGVDEAQGYHIAKPQSLDHLSDANIELRKKETDKSKVVKLISR
ncbi:MAG: EAL domain-containing protein [Gammaproteobacteria bacterium]|nr:EAL domain-containing protein [Gammaproteobacteria bacterium]